MNQKKFDFSKYLQENSSRHHYIPEFLIKGFTNSDGKVYIYNKQKDKIINRPQSPKSYFFEEHRNTIELNNYIKTSIIEDLFYQEIDDKVSKIIQCYQTEELSEVNFKEEDTTLVLFFLIILFWRIPKTDSIADHLIEKSIITSDDIDPEILRNDPSFRKITRANFFKHHIEEMQNSLARDKWNSIRPIENSAFVIGDFPFLFRKAPTMFKEFENSDILFAICSKRLYLHTNERSNVITTTDSFRYNAAIINQSVKYIACCDLKVLEQSIDCYKRLKEENLLYFSIERIFQNCCPSPIKS